MSTYKTDWGDVCMKLNEAQRNIVKQNEDIKVLNEQRDKMMKKIQGYDSQLWTFDVYKSGMFGSLAKVKVILT